MADVTGSIGSANVQLNNAATEATLRQLLSAVQQQGGVGAAGAVGAAAGAAGVNTAAIEAAKAAAKAQKELAEKTAKLKETFSNLASGLEGLAGKLIQGTDKSSDLFAAFENLPGVAGLVATRFRQVAQFQEQNLDAYQKITNAGVSFGGSLTDMRTAAASTYMTLDQFTNLMKNNSETFAKMGSTAEQGARAFTAMSNSLLKSEAGSELRALGYITEQVNQGMLNYIAVTGGRTKDELRNTSALTKGASEYLTQLDALATITGKSREEQEKQLKEASANAAYEAYLQTLDEDGRKKATLAMQNALATGGKGGADLLKSQLLGLPPMTEAAQKLQALGPNVAKGINQMGEAVQDTRKTTQDVNKGYAAAQYGATQDMQKFGKTAAALSFGTDSTSQALMSMQTQANRNTAQGIKSQQDVENQLRLTASEQKKRQESEAKAAADAQKAIQELGQSLLNILMPAIKLLTAVINPLAKFVSAVMTQFEKLNGIVQTIIVTGLAYLAYQKMKRATDAATSALGQNPPPGGAGGGAGTGRGGRLAGALKGGIGGVVGGLALGAAADYARENEKENAATGLDIASQAATFAGLGAMLGSIVPGVGTAIGAGVGGVAGAGYGLYQNWGKLFGNVGEEKKMAAGGIVTQPTNILAGEAGSEAIVPLRHLESLRTELETLNKNTIEMLRYMKETADYAKKNVDATKGLSGDLFKF